MDVDVLASRTAYVVEVKRQHEIGAAIVDEMERKLKQIPLRKGMSARPVLVYDGEPSASVEGCGYFDAIIPARKLLGL